MDLLWRKSAEESSKLLPPADTALPGPSVPV